MKKADRKHFHAENIIVISGNNNKISLYETSSQKLIVTAILIIVVAVSVLTVSIICPEQVSDYVRWIIGFLVSR
jgi:hypothetical protein